MIRELLDSRVSLVPFGMLLESTRGLDDGKVIAGSGEKLKANGKILVRESARN